MSAFVFDQTEELALSVQDLSSMHATRIPTEQEIYLREQRELTTAGAAYYVRPLNCTADDFYRYLGY